jgi:hypothetical protein
MNRFRYGMVYVFGLLMVAGCGDDLGSQAGEGVVLSATPTQLFLDIGESKTVDVSATDNSGNAVALDFVVTDPGTGISVRRDSTFLPVYVDDSTLQVPPTAERFRFVVTGAGYNATHFTVTAGATTIDVPVQVVPRQAIEATINNAAPVLGEVVTITAAPGTHFSANSVVQAPAGALAVPFTAGVAPDGSSISAVLPPNLVDAQLTITNVTSDASPGVLYAPLTSFTVTTPVVESWTGTISNLAPAVNEAVTATVTGATLIDTTNLILGSGAPTITNLTPNSVTFIPAPGASGLLVINGVVLDAQPQTPLPLAAPITDTLNVAPDVPTTPGTDASATAPSLITPALGFSSAFFDNPTFDGAALVDAYYKLVVTEAGLYTITMDWTVGDDIDLLVCPEAGVDDFDCDFAAATGDHPESSDYALEPGTYFIVADDFAAYDEDDTTAPAVGTSLTITVDHAPPAAPAVKVAKVKAGASSSPKRLAPRGNK